MNLVGKRVKCGRCLHVWCYTGVLVFANCPSCAKRVQVRELPKEGNK